VAIIEPVIFGDERGHFFESFNVAALARLGVGGDFVQDNQSRSRRGILRGLHYQIGCPQDKLIRCLAGVIYDVVVDVRQGSPTFGRWVGVELTSENKRMVWIPKGFAHGFLTVSDSADVAYKVTDYWSKDAERGIRWNDPGIGITWPDVGGAPSLNARDAGFPALADAPAGDLPQYQS
jgi:dTDP-4-dehydrorhamnose 3,5-epimerase